MPRTIHPAHWPDKIIFAALLLVIGGALGALFALVQLAGATVSDDLAHFMYVTPPGAALALSLATIVLAATSLRRQASAWAWGAVATGIASMGLLGFVPVLCLIAAGFLLRSRAEGEEVGREGPLDIMLWADKAIAASLLLFVGGLISLFQALMLWRSDLDLPLVRDAPQLVAVASALAGLVSLAASFEVYRLRRAWLGYVGAALGFLSFAFLVFGPALAIGAFVMLQKARAEKEFADAPAAAA